MLLIPIVVDGGAAVPAIELSVLSRQCLDRRIPDVATWTQAVATWEHVCNAIACPVNWHFTTPDARIKPKHLGSWGEKCEPRTAEPLWWRTGFSW